ncbi:PH domain-containing protein [Rhodopirellula halodulae]|uniref:PH domain-containing protein n=1 Tax=Rhodopirellula halodulae TaxID=2894198 RepID=UPI001E61674C|nr:PH domain-containing protein [Rhodopirellula sp. JC737]MCC9657315.1 PH domain-containing protein [Rhodopirellula sp. JC737]
MTDTGKPTDDPTTPDSATEPTAADPLAPAASSTPPTSPADDRTPRQRFEEAAASKRSLDDHEPEETLWEGGYSPKAMVGSWIGLTLISIGLLVAAGFIEQLTFGIALIVIAVLWILVGLSYAAKRLGVHYELTSQRFIHKTGILTRRTDRIEVIDIDDVSYQQGPIQRIFQVGTISITSSDRSDPELELIGINKVGEVAGLIDDIRRSERRRRSLHIESI